MYHYPWTLQSVFPKDKNTVEYNHRRVINCWKFNIVILFYIIKSMISYHISDLSYFSVISWPNNCFCGILLPQCRAQSPPLRSAHYCSTNTAVSSQVSSVTERGSWLIPSLLLICLHWYISSEREDVSIRSWLHLIPYLALTY